MWVVMAFNADIGAYDLCRGKYIKTRPGERALRLAAAWCFDGRQDSMVEAAVGPATGVSDRRFRALVGQTVLNLFPQHMDRELLDDNDRGRRRRSHKR
jgi:hypothetical protein